LTPVLGQQLDQVPDGGFLVGGNGPDFQHVPPARHDDQVLTR